MAKGRSQLELFPRSKRPVIDIDPNHFFLVLTNLLDWTRLIEIVQSIRKKKLKNMAGRPPKLRATLGAVIFMSLRDLTYRDTEDYIRHYGPARYLCGLTETTWTPDFTTIQDFTELMGEEGIRKINEEVVLVAKKEKLADPRVAVADMTAQEASIPHPREMGLMSSFLQSLSKSCRKAGSALKKFGMKIQSTTEIVKKKVREYHLLEKTQEGKRRLIEEVVELVEKVQQQLIKAVRAGEKSKARLKGYGKVAHQKAAELNVTMKKLVPQIRSWLQTGKVAKGKIINMFISEVRSVVRGKVGKKVEFGVLWGIERIKGGFVLGRMAKVGERLHDTKYVLEAVSNHKTLFGKAPEVYGYDRGGYRPAIPEKLRKLGVKHVGVAPQGQANWEVSGKIKKQIQSERAKVEGSIGIVKGRKYGFNKPRARSYGMMGACGQRALLGLNLNNYVRGLAKREKMILEC